MKMNVEYNGVGEEPESEKVEGGEVSEDRAETSGEIEEAELPNGRRPGCKGKVRVNEGDAW